MTPDFAPNIRASVVETGAARHPHVTGAEDAGSAETALIDALCEAPRSAASHSAYLGLVSILASSCRRIQSPDHHRGINAIQAACVYQRDPWLVRAILEILQKNGGDLSRPTAHHPSGFHLALQEANPAAVEALMQLGAGMRLEDAQSVRSAINAACDALRYPGDFSQVKIEAAMRNLRLLAAAGATIDNVQEEGVDNRAPVLILLSGGNDHGHQGDLHDAVTLLIEMGADVNAHEPATKRTALHYAAMRGYWRTALVLLLRGADLEAIDARQFMSAQYAEQFASQCHELRAILRSAEMNRIIFQECMGSAAAP